MMSFWNRKALTVNDYFYAAATGKLDIVKECIRQGVDKNAKNMNRMTALHIASWNGNLEIVKYLIETCHVDKEAKNNNGRTALHCASANGHLEIVKYLVEKCRVDKEAKNNYGSTSLHCASANGHLEIVKYLVENGHIDKDAKDIDGRSAHDLAMIWEKSVVAQYLLKVSVDTTAVNGRISMSTTPLEKATSDQNKTSAAALSLTDQPHYWIGNMGAMITSSGRREDSKQPAPTVEDFFIAVRGGNLNKMKEYIKFDMNKEVKDKNGWGALHLATFHGHMEIVKYLIEKCHVDKEAKSNCGSTALHCASGYDRLEIVKYLIETCRVDKEAKSDSGWTALHCASGYGRLEVVRYLTETCLVNKEAKDHLGSTALHFASSNGNLEIVKYLIEKCHVDKEAKNNNGQSASGIAMANNKIEVAWFLMSGRKDVVTVNASVNMSPTPLKKATNEKLKGNDITAALSLFFDEPHSSIGILGGKGGEWKESALTVEDYMRAAYDGNVDKVKECISNGVNKEAKNKYGQTALHLACKAGSVEMVKYLIQRCQVDKEAKNTCGLTSLHFASIHGHLDIVKYLIQKYQVDKEATTMNGWTALHFASRFGHLEIVKYLIEKGHVDKEAKNKNGESANDIAIENYKNEVAWFLMSGSKDGAAVSAIINVPTKLFEKVTMDQNNNSVATVSSSADQPQTSISSEHNPLVLTSVSSKSSLPAFELNEAWILSLQNENQQLVDKLSQMDSSIKFIDERRDLIDLIVVEQCMTIEEQDEQRAILASPKHRDFYLLLQRKLKCMIISCETLSTGMVSVGGGDMRAFCARTINENGYNIFKNKKVGFFIASAIQWSKKNFAFVPFVDTIGSIFQVIATLDDERDQYVGLAHVADFATLACLPHYGATSLDVTIEKVARYLVRARNSALSCVFVEEKDQFGKLKQLMINLLADSGNTPAKEQASVAADCAFAHIMKPSDDSVLFDLLNDSKCDVGLAEAVAATILGISVQDLEQLEPFPVSPPADAILPTIDTPYVNATTVNVSTTPPFHSAAHALSNVVAEQVAKVQKQEELIQQQNDTIQRQEEMMRKQNEMIQQLSHKVARLEKCADNDSGGGGTTYAKPEEVFKNEIAAIKILRNDVKGLTNEVTTIDYQVAQSNLRILMLEERFQYLECNTTTTTKQNNRNGGNRKGR